MVLVVDRPAAIYGRSEDPDNFNYSVPLLSNLLVISQWTIAYLSDKDTPELFDSLEIDGDGMRLSEPDALDCLNDKKNYQFKNCKLLNIKGGEPQQGF
ncbi:hypothetical protein L596_017649 [Steinernema carpocapsae]|uniref:Uncharacterized protein n=1 Tax=Steinernema carpocapsae TaxID=34508 RepID=A0A4V6A1S3_STECR|nr:hypothetical protein L596_017649 [Steinernema carpocapsae]